MSKKNKTLKLKYNSYHSGKSILWLIMGLLLLFGNTLEGLSQVRVPFKVRTSQESPSKKIYSLHGDFNLIGNTNLTLLNYEVGSNNNNNQMRYVDVDNDASTWNSSSADLSFSTENGALTSCTNIVFAGLYWTGKSAADNSTNSSNDFSLTKIINGQSVTKNFCKRKILLKGPSANGYSEIIANEDAIYYPNSSDAFIYSAYTEVTDYVRQHGVGTYFAADMALAEGNGGGTGYSGGWGLVVIYENTQMKHRDISLFDGHAFVLNSNTLGYNLEISGFHTVQTGNVGVKLGLMASEGDVGLNGDYFQIQKNSDLSFTKLQHSQNTVDNFFNSSINNSATRNPNLTNNTGIDIGMFEISNPNNAIIGNNQTATNFRYGTTSDTYAIFAMVLAVDSYVPEVENVVSVTAINNVVPIAPLSALPGQDIKLKVAIKNTQAEAVHDFKITIPIPYNASYIEESAVGNRLHPPTQLLSNEIYFDANLGANGSLVWQYGNLPLSEDPTTVLATLSFKIKASTDCTLLHQPDCANTIIIDGFSDGVGTVSGVVMTRNPFILGYTDSGSCVGNPIRGPITIPINGTEYVSNHCQNTASIRNFTFCDPTNMVSVATLASHFPVNSMFYNTFPITQNTIQYSNSTPLLINPGTTTTYYAVQPNGNITCIVPFTLSKCIEITANPDTGNTINESVGGIAIYNVLNNDFHNGQTALATQLTLHFVSATNPGITLEGCQVIVAAGTPPGNYTLTYQICDLVDLTKCDEAIVNITVTSTQIIAENNVYEYQCSTAGILGNILANDTLNETLCSTNDVLISVVSQSNPNINIDLTSGMISIANGLTVGRYEIEYKISSRVSPTSFDTATITINIVDTTEPDIPLLDDVVKYCEASVTAPSTTDNCSGLITATTHDALNYYEVGSYILHWTFTDESGNQTTAQQNVTVKSAEETEPSYGYINCNLDNDFSLNIDLNSYLPEDIDADGAWSSVLPTPNLNGSVFSPYQAPTGNYEFEYIREKSNCYQTLKVVITVNDDCFVAPACNLLVHNAFSPNNDGVNDFFFIENIDQTFCFPTNSVEIYNRWGVLVYKTKQYDNVTSVFRGISEGRLTINESEQLPTGTYYYMINYTDDKGNIHDKVGYVYLSL